MNSPMSPVLNTRETYSKWLQKVITEVEVQFEHEEPDSGIPPFWCC